MKNTLILFSLLLIIGCKKEEKTTITPSNSLQATADSIGFLFEHTYHIADNPNPAYDTLYHSNSIIFHTNGTVREFSKTFDTTYSAIYIVIRNLATSIYKSGISIKVVTPTFNYTGTAEFITFSHLAQKQNDTLAIGNYESGFMLYNNKSTLGCLHGTTASGNFLWLN